MPILNHTTPLGFNMTKYTEELAGLIPGEKYEEARFAEFDRIAERNALIDEETDIELSVRMKDITVLEDTIADNADVLASIILNGKDVELKIIESIKHWIRNDIEREL